MKSKVCPKCKRELGVDQFSKNSTRKDGLQSECRGCFKRRMKKYRQRRPKAYLEYYQRKNTTPERLKYMRKYRQKYNVIPKNRVRHIWHLIWNRCYNPFDPGYEDYGLIGIRMCKRWRDPVVGPNNFYNDMVDKCGVPKPEESTDRIDNDFGYSPENCRWLDFKGQQNNKSNTYWITYNEKTQSLSLWAEEIGINIRTLYSRLNSYGWPVEKALTTPIRKTHERRKISGHQT